MGHILSQPIESKYTERKGNSWLRIGSCEMQGYRVNMEDTCVICCSLQKHNNTAVFGVFDGTYNIRSYSL